MPQPITSKLAVVAHCMDTFVRLDNEALTVANGELHTEVIRLAEEAVAQAIETRHREQQLFNRIQELEFQLERQLDHGERLANRVYVLESSILDCPNHPQRAEFFVYRPVRRNLEPEMIDLTTDEEVTDTDPEDMDL